MDDAKAELLFRQYQQNSYIGLVFFSTIMNLLVYQEEELQAKHQYALTQFSSSLANQQNLSAACRTLMELSGDLP